MYKSVQLYSYLLFFLLPVLGAKYKFITIIQAIYSNSLTKYTTFDNYLIIMDDYSNTTKLYGMENITTEEVIDKQNTFRVRFGKVDECG